MYLFLVFFLNAKSQFYANIVGPGKTPSVASDLGQHCLSLSFFGMLSMSKSDLQTKYNREKVFACQMSC